MAISINSVSVTPNVTTVGQTITITIVAEDVSWDTIKNEFQDWNEVKTTLSNWSAIKNYVNR